MRTKGQYINIGRKKVDLLDQAAELLFPEDKRNFFAMSVSVFLSRLQADLIPQNLIETRVSFTFEMVISAPGEMVLLQKKGVETTCVFRRKISMLIHETLSKAHANFIFHCDSKVLNAVFAWRLSRFAANLK